MLNTVFASIAAFFTMLTTFFQAGEKVAKATDNLAGWAEESSAAFYDEAKHNRAITLEEAAFKREQKKKELDDQRIQYDINVSTKATKGKAPAVTAP